MYQTGLILTSRRGTGAVVETVIIDAGYRHRTILCLRDGDTVPQAMLVLCFDWVCLGHVILIVAVLAI